jgi:hypothetical protein
MVCTYAVVLNPWGSPVREIQIVDITAELHPELAVEIN